MIAGAAGAWYEDHGAYTEGFSRPLWGLVPLWAGGGDIDGFPEIYAEGITAGSDPASDEYWGDCHDRDQRFVEMAAMAYGIIFAPGKVWEPLSDTAKDNFASWLLSINDHEVCDSNWIFFRVLVNIAMKKIGRSYDAELLEKDLCRIEEFYIGDGWYMDGEKGQKDYYIPFAFHFYGLIYASVMGEDDPERCARFKERAGLFGKQYIYWFADDGEALPYGRSLTYRFAQLSYWSACLIAGVYPFEIGVIKGIIMRGMREWFKNDDIFDNGRVLTVGYKYPSLLMGEHYNAPGSPYWSMKTFALLMLPDGHEFWSCEEKPLPVLDDVKSLPCADMLMARNDGEVYAYPAGTHNELGCGQIPAKYLKFAYSTLFGFNVSRSQISLDECAPDNMLVFVVDGLTLIRRRNISHEIQSDRVITRWSPFKGIEVETTIIPMRDGHRRIHKIYSDIDCDVYECGYAAANRDCDGLTDKLAPDYCELRNSFSYSAVSAVRAENARICGAKRISASPNTNLFFRKTDIPSVCFKAGRGESIIECEIKAGKVK